MKKKFDVQGMMCASCQANVERAVRGLSGVEAVNVSLLGKNMIVDFDESALAEEEIVSAVTSCGYGCSPFVNQTLRDIQKAKEATMKKTFRRLMISVVLLLVLMAFSMIPMIPAVMEAIDRSGHVGIICFSTVTAQILLLIPILALNSGRFASGYRSLIKRHPNMDALVALGSTISVLYGLYLYVLLIIAFTQNNPGRVMEISMNLYFESAAMIPVFVSLGKYIEAKATSKTTSAISSLMALAPETAIVRKEEGDIEVMTEDIQEGDVVVIKPGMSIPVDGVILSGYASMDESAISGESVPVYKEVGAKVVAGTVNKEGSFTFRVTGVGKDTTLAKIIALVEEAGSSKAPMARLADRISGVFVPVVIGISLFTFALWMLLSGLGVVGQNRPDWSLSLQLSVSVLVVSCPCALGLATPVAVMVGTGKGAEHGILFKSAEALELCRNVDVVLFDKTGTLSKGRMSVQDFVLYQGQRQEILSKAAALESRSEHPLSKAIVSFVKGESISFSEASSFEYVPGKGIKGEGILIGNRALLEQNGVESKEAEEDVRRLSSMGKTVLYFVEKDRICALFAIGDEEKENAAKTIQTLQKAGKKVAIVTGDSKLTAAYFADVLGVDQVYAEVLPEEKERIVSSLQKEGFRVAFVGDGVNDAPALSKADVGIAIGTGTEIALESSDVLLVRSDPLDVCAAMELSRRVTRNIKQNLTWAFAYNALLIPLAAGAFYAISVAPNWFTGSQSHLVLTPMIASFAMSLSSITVVLNALRLKRANIDTKEE